MPGSPFMAQTEVQQTVGVPQGANTVLAGDALDHGSFVIWLVVIGVVIPVMILGGLKLGGFQFVFKSR